MSFRDTVLKIFAEAGIEEIHRDVLARLEEATSRHAALMTLLAHLGWVLEYDAEGDFFEDGAHARVVQTILALQQIVPNRATDEWLPDVSLRLSLEIDGSQTYFYLPSDEADPHGEGSPSDWIQWSIVRDAVVVALSGRDLRFVRLVHADLEIDQICVVGVLPSKLLDGLSGAELLAPFDPYGPPDFDPHKLNVAVEHGGDTRISAERYASLRPRP